MNCQLPDLPGVCQLTVSLWNFLESQVGIYPVDSSDFERLGHLHGERKFNRSIIKGKSDFSVKRQDGDEGVPRSALCSEYSRA